MYLFVITAAFLLAAGLIAVISGLVSAGICFLSRFKFGLRCDVCVRVCREVMRAECIRSH